MRNQRQWFVIRGGWRGAGQWVLGSGVLVAVLAVAGCRGAQYASYPGVPQPAYAQTDQFKPGHEEELAAEASRLREEAQFTSYEESGEAVASDQAPTNR
jgi:hypothetical protein